MNRAICAMELHYDRRGDQSILQDTADEIRSALRCMVQDHYDIPSIHPMQEDSVDEMNDMEMLQGAPRHPDENEETMEEGSLLEQWESYICKVAVTGYRLALRESTELEGERPAQKYKGIDQWTDEQNREYVEQLVKFMYGPRDPKSPNRMRMRVIDSTQSELMKGAHGDKLAHAKTRVCITRNTDKIREHLARQKEADVRVAIQRHEENMHMHSTKTVVSIYSTVYRAFLGISALEEYMEEARATMKNDMFVTGGAR